MANCIGSSNSAKVTNISIHNVTGTFFVEVAKSSQSNKPTDKKTVR